MMPDGHDADAFRHERARRASTCRSAPGLGKLAGKVFRIGHLGYFNDLMLCGTLCGVEMGLALRSVPHRKGGVLAALAISRRRPARGATPRPHKRQASTTRPSRTTRSRRPIADAHVIRRIEE